MVEIGAGPKPVAEAFDADLLRAQKAVEAAIPNAGNDPFKFLLDNLEAVWSLC